jgi:hypothetical protein
MLPLFCYLYVGTPKDLHLPCIWQKIIQYENLYTKLTQSRVTFTY